MISLGSGDLRGQRLICPRLKWKKAEGGKDKREKGRNQLPSWLANNIQSCSWRVGDTPFLQAIVGWGFRRNELLINHPLLFLFISFSFLIPSSFFYLFFKNISHLILIFISFITSIFDQLPLKPRRRFSIWVLKILIIWKEKKNWFEGKLKIFVSFEGKIEWVWEALILWRRQWVGRNRILFVKVLTFLSVFCWFSRSCRNVWLICRQ